MLACWLLFPLIMAVLSLGTGLLVCVIGGARVDQAAVMPLGFAAIAVISTAVSEVSGLRPIATVVVVILALLGLALGRRRWWPRPPWLVLASVIVFLSFAAPVLLSGQATFAGYTRLDDASTFMALTARLVDRGREVSGLAPSTYARTVQAYLTSGYPVGSLVPLGTVQPLVGQNLAWLFQPYMSFLGALLAMVLWALVAPLVSSPRLRVAIVGIAAQPAILYAYATEEGAVKELTMAVLVALVAYVAAPLLRGDVRRGRLLAAAVVAAALLDTYSLGAFAWLGPPGLAIAGAWALAARKRSARRGLVVGALGGAALTCLLALPTIDTIGAFTKSTADLRAASVDLGNLGHPLSVLQIFGIWPASDFRTGLGGDALPAALLIGTAMVMAVLGLRFAWRRRSVELLLYGAAAAAAFLIVKRAGSGWVVAKAMAVTSPVLITLAAVGVASWAWAGRRALALATGGAMAAGVLWSNVLAYHGVALAPRDRLAELAHIGARYRGQGPTLLNEFEPYGARLLLRATDAEAPAELRVRPVYLRNGAYLQEGQVAHLDQFDPASLLVYRTIVVRRSPEESRPPAMYSLERVLRYYEVWQRPTRSPGLLDDLPLRAGLDPAGVASCRQAAQLARVAKSQGARLVAAPASPLVALAAGRSAHPPSWTLPGDPEHLRPSSPGTAVLALSVPRAGRYTVWLGGSFARGVSLTVDGRAAGRVRYELNFAGQYNAFGALALTAGPHAFMLRYPGGDLHPGSAQQPLALGPLVLAPSPPVHAPLISVAPSHPAELCRRPLEWIEVVKP